MRNRNSKNKQQTIIYIPYISICVSSKKKNTFVPIRFISFLVCQTKALSKKLSLIITATEKYEIYATDFNDVLHFSFSSHFLLFDQ